MWTASAQFLRKKRIPPEKGQRLYCPPSGVLLFPDCSHVPNGYLLINHTFCNSIKGGVMVYKGGVALMLKAIHSFSAVIWPLTKSVWEAKGLLCEVFGVQYSSTEIISMWIQLLYVSAQFRLSQLKCFVASRLSWICAKAVCFMCFITPFLQANWGTSRRKVEVPL